MAHSLQSSVHYADKNNRKRLALDVNFRHVLREAVSTKKRKPTQKNRKNRMNRGFFKIRSKIETTVKKDTTRYTQYSRKILNVRYFEDVIKFQTKYI